jgi:hypothetical protein
VAAAAAWAAREAAEAAAGIPHMPTDAEPWAQAHPHEFAQRQQAWLTEQCQQAALLRCIVGDPFRPARLDAAWLTGTVVRVAEAIYEGRRWGEMGVLGDALEEAGCTDEELLSHCRRPSSHTRGCWVVDALLGKT